MDTELKVSSNIPRFDDHAKTNIGHQNSGGNISKSSSQVNKKLMQDGAKRANSIAMPELSRDGFRKKVLVIYTGGTIGMVKNQDGVLEPTKGTFEKLVRSYPQLHDWKYLERMGASGEKYKECLVLPETDDSDTIFYKIYEYPTLLDSSNIAAENWIQIATDIMSNYEMFDGFVVLHGTDTLAYTASAVSFLLENIGKCVVLTGSQIPMFGPRSDGVNNFVSSLMIAGTLDIPEVTVFFGNKLMRGNRVRKMSASNLHAFDSPNCAPLVEVGINLSVNRKHVFRPTTIDKCRLHPAMSRYVAILRIFPSIKRSVLRAFLSPPVEGVVMETFGSGNIPTDRRGLIEEIAAAVERGVIVVNITQCITGTVSDPIYETGTWVTECGVLPGYDMTPEAALTKLAYVISKTEWDHATKLKMMTQSLRGEITSTGSLSVQDSSTLTDALARCLRIQSPSQVAAVSDRVLAALLLYAIDTGDERTLGNMLELGADVNAQDFGGRAPLHQAVCTGNIKIVEYLLKHGANVHMTTRSGQSPLLLAVQCDQPAIIATLRQCGAHIGSGAGVADLALRAARTGALQRLRLLHLAGGDLDAADETRQTALHKAVLCDCMPVVEFLIEHGANTQCKDVLGLTPLDYAVQLNREQMALLLKNNTRAAKDYDDDIEHENNIPCATL